MPNQKTSPDYDDYYANQMDFSDDERCIRRAIVETVVNHVMSYNGISETANQEMPLVDDYLARLRLEYANEMDDYDFEKLCLSFTLEDRNFFRAVMHAIDEVRDL